MNLSQTRLIAAVGIRAYRLSRLRSLHDWLSLRAPSVRDCQVLTRFFGRLVSNSITDHAFEQCYSSFGSVLRLSVKERFEYYGLPQISRPEPSPFYRHLTETLRAHALSAQGADLRHRILAAVSEYPSHPWFHVTLTVRPSSYAAVFSTGSRCFRDYVREIKRDVAAALWPHLSRRALLDHARSVRQWLVHYTAVLEKGERGGRRHIHALLCLAKLPSSWRDPNRGRARPIAHELPAMKRHWVYGFCTPKPLRLGKDDAFASLGWVWPWDPKTGAPSRGYTSYVAAGYLSKYLTKQCESASDRNYRFRTRYSRTFGQSLLRLWTSLAPRYLDQMASFCDNSLFYSAFRVSLPRVLPLPSRAYFARFLASVLYRDSFQDLPYSELSDLHQQCRLSSPVASILRTFLGRTASVSTTLASPSTQNLLGRSATPLMPSSPVEPLPPVNKLLPMRLLTQLMIRSKMVKSGQPDPLMSHGKVSICNIATLAAKAAEALAVGSFTDGPFSSLVHSLVAATPSSLLSAPSALAPIKPVLAFGH